MIDDDMSISVYRTVCAINDQNGPLHVSIHATLPPFLTRAYATRHQLSYNDIMYIFESMTAQSIWFAAVVYGIDMVISAIRVSYADHKDVYITNKSMVTDKLVHRIHPTPSPLDKIDTVNTYGHSPSLPRHTITHTDYIFLQSILVPCITIDTSRASGLYAWGGSNWVALSVEDIYIYAVRVISLETHQKLHRPQKQCYAYTTAQIFVNHLPYMLTEEGVLFRSDQ
jgi:hypothetical protein